MKKKKKKKYRIILLSLRFPFLSGVYSINCCIHEKWPLIFQGEEGVREVLQILNDEFRLSMALSGELAITVSVFKSLIKRYSPPPRLQERGRNQPEPHTVF